MNYLSVCSGIEAATVAWHPLGWTPFGFAEVEAFPSAMLAHHYGSNLPNELWRLGNGVPNFGDMNNFKEWPNAAIDVLVGGTPCQSFSVAGLRKGLADPRGNLCLTYLAIADRYRPEWLVWENVPGVLSSGDGRDFGAFIGGLAELGYNASWRVLDAQYVRVDGFGRAVPQRRRRVFVVGHLGDWRRSAAVLFEPESLSGHRPPSRQQGQGAAPTISSRPTGGGGLGTDFDLDGGLVARALNAKGGAGRSDGESETFIAHALRAEGFDASEDGTGRGTPIVPVVAASLTRGAESAGKGGYAGRRQEDDVNLVARGITIHGTDKTARVASYTDVAGALRTKVPGSQENSSSTAVMQPVAFQPRFARNGRGAPDVVASALTSEAGRTGKGDSAQCVAFGIRSDASRDGEAKTPSADADGYVRLRNPGLGIYEGLAPTLDASTAHTVATSWAVRRLTPRECERLQGFPDCYTAIPYRGKPAADGPRYKALGNSMAVNVMRWLGRRIEMVNALARAA